MEIKIKKYIQINNLKPKYDRKNKNLETGQQHRYLDSHYYSINITPDLALL